MYNVKDHLLTRPGLKPAGQPDLNWAKSGQPVLKLQNTPGQIANQPARFKAPEYSWPDCKPASPF